MPPGWQGVVARWNRSKLRFGVVNGIAEIMRLRMEKVMNVVGLENILAVEGVL